MRIRSLLGTAGLLVATVVTIASTARAEEEFDVSVSGDSVTVTAKGAWHINNEYTWKVKKDGHTVDSVHFSLAEKTATASGLPHGAVTVKGAVCNTDGDHKACKPFSKDVTIN